MQKLNQKYINSVVKKALDEDLKPRGDITTNLISFKNKESKAKVIANTLLCEIALERVVAPRTGYIDTTLPKQSAIIKISIAASIHAKNAQLPAFLAVSWALKSHPEPTIDVAAEIGGYGE